MVSLSIGPSYISAEKVAGILINLLTASQQPSEPAVLILLQIRLPRVLAGAVVGASLSTAGVAFQGIFRNSMADPYVIGVSSGAALGAALAIVLGTSFNIPGIADIPLLAFIGALLTILVVYNVARVGSRVPVTTLLLSGIAFSIFLSALVALLEVFAGWQLHTLVFWLMGGFSYVELKELWIVGILASVGIVIIYVYARDLNILQLGEDEARHLGVATEKTKKVLIVAGSLATAAAVSISGIIGFVGLIIPHVTRLIVGPDHRILIPSSILVGAMFIMLCDTLSRMVLAPIDLPVGIVTALSGGPFFIYLLKKRKGVYEI
jgi:iron complex transport system permease protein